MRSGSIGRREGAAGALHHAGAEVEHQVGHLQPVQAFATFGAPHQGGEAQFQFAQFKRLGQVIVGAFAETGDLVVQGGTRGQHQYRRRGLRVLAQAAAQGEAVDAGQHQVEHDDVVRLGDRQMQAGDAIHRHIHLMAMALQKVGDVRRQVGAVFNDQDGKENAVAHGRPGKGGRSM